MKISLIFAEKNPWWETYGIELTRPDSEVIKTAVYYHIPTDAYQVLEPINKEEFAEITKRLRELKLDVAAQ